MGTSKKSLYLLVIVVSYINNKESHPTKVNQDTMSLFPNIVLLIWLITVPLAQSPFGEKTTVRVTNMLGWKLDLILHCKSGDDDLGQKLLYPGQNFEWRFRSSYFGSTLFFCSFQWFGEQGLKHFDIYVEERDADYSLCIWHIKKDGPCFLKNESPLEWQCYPWKKE